MAAVAAGDNRAPCDVPGYEGCDGPQRTLRDFPPLVASAVRIAWAAGRRPLTISAGLQLVAGLGLGLQVLLARDVLQGVLSADRGNGDFSDFLPSVLALAALTSVLGFVAAVEREQRQILRELTKCYTQSRVLDVACAVELEAFDVPGFHDRLARAEANAETGPFNLVSGLSQLLGAAVGALALIVALLALEPLLVPLAILVFVPAMLATSQRGEAYYRFAFGMTPRDRERTYLARVLTEIETAKEVRAFGTAGFLRGRHDRLWAQRLAELRGVVRKQLFYSLIANLGIAAIVGGTLATLVAFALTGRISLAEAGAAAGAIVLLGTRLVEAGNGAGSLYESALFVDDLSSFMELGSEVGTQRPLAPAPTGFERLVAEDIVFTYRTRTAPALNGVSLEVRAGEVVALVGDNGSGKTTLAKLLCGLYVPDSGRISWNGVDISTCDRQQLRSQLAVIFQDFVRYNLSARDNIALGSHERFDDERGIGAAAEQAGIAETLDRLPQGFDTLLGPRFEGGAELSIGQWQRVALARAFFRDAPFVILDEPTAALDAKAEHDLFAGIRSLLVGRSVLFISHRFSSVRTADRIYVLKDGLIIEVGSHEELMALDGYYAELFTLQAKAYLDPSRNGSAAAEHRQARAVSEPPPAPPA